jgi:hypothetical protein
MQKDLKRTFTFRIADETWNKFHDIAKANKRSVNAELELLVERYIARIEAENQKTSPDSH